MTPMGNWESALVARLVEEVTFDALSDADELMGADMTAKCRWTESDGA